MKVLIISNLFPNKMEPNKAMFNKQQFGELSKLCELKIVAPLPYLKYSLGEVPKKEIIDDIEVYHPRYLVIPKVLRSLYGVFYFLGVIGRVREIYRSFKFDVILSSWVYPDGFGSALIARIFRKPFIIKVHGTDVNVLTQYFLRREMILYTFKRADMIIAVSKALKEKIISLGIPEEKIQLISNGVDTDLFRPIQKKACRDKLGLPLDKRIVLYIGNLEKVKGIDLLVDAMKYLPGDIELAVIGTGPLRNRLRSAKRISFYGSRSHSEIPLWMNACDVFCLPSRNEGCPNVILEAMACGVPIVASRTGGIPELIKSEKSGILVSPGNLAELSEGIHRALEIKWERESVENYSWKENAGKVFKELESVYESRNILYHHRTQGTGAEGVHIASIIKGFKRLGHKVYVVSPPGVNPEKTRGGNPYGKKKGFIRRTLAFLSSSLPQYLFEILEILYNVRAHFKMLNVLKDRRIDFIYERYAFFMFAGVRLAKKSGIPIILEVNEIAGEKRVRAQYFTGISKRIERYVFRNVDAIIVVSSFLKEKMKEMGIDGEKIFIMPNAVDEDIFSKETVEKTIENKYFVKNGALVIGFIGWFVKWHNIESLIDVFSKVAKKFQSYLFLVGDGALKDKFKEMAIDRNIEDRVIFPGSIPYDDIPNYIDLMDICVVPGSNEYRSPIKLFEYMSMGKAVIAPKYKAIESIIEDGKDGMLFEPENGNSLEKILEELVSDSKKRKALGKKAREKVVKNHTWLGNARKVVEIYEGFDI